MVFHPLQTLLSYLLRVDVLGLRLLDLILLWGIIVVLLRLVQLLDNDLTLRMLFVPTCQIVGFVGPDHLPALGGGTGLMDIHHGQLAVLIGPAIFQVGGCPLP